MIIIKPKIDYDCDVLIVGGGPAGSGLAFHLASKGINVIVVDAEKFPRDKICGDGISPIALGELDLMGITETDKFKKANEIKKVGLFLNNEKVFIDLMKPENVNFHARIIPRIELDALIVEAAKKASAKYIESTRVVSYEVSANYALVNLKNGSKTYSLKTKLIVGADGSNSTIARQLHGKKPEENYQLLGLRAYYDNVNGPTDRVDIYFNSEGFPGIFWMFPKGEKGANIGIAMISQTIPYKPEHIKELLLKHINNNPEILKRIGKGFLEGKIEGCPITFFNPERKIISDRLILIGEAAGLINPLSGDGIQYALLSSRWASETIEKCVNTNNFGEEILMEYTNKLISEIGYDFAFSDLLVQFSRNKTFTPLWITIVKILIARAKKDKEYAGIVAGIFEGTHPSYKALTVPFILKSILQAGVEIEETISSNLKKPESIVDYNLNKSRLILNMIKEIKQYPKDHIQWVTNTITKTVKVALYVVKNSNNKNP